MLHLFVLVYSLLTCIKCDGANLQNVPELFVLHRKGILRYNMADRTYAPYLEMAHAAAAMDIDVRNGMLYWSSFTEVGNSVFSVNLKTKEIDTILPETNAEGLAVDWVHGNLYVSDTLLGHIIVSRLSGSNRKVLVSEDMGRLRDVVVDPYYGWMYWSDWGDVPKIEKCGMNGRQRKAIVTTNIGWPNGLAIDYVQKRLYWVDAKMHYIASTDMEGQDRRMVLQGQSVKHPFAITCFEDFLYWSDWIGEKSIHKINKMAPGEDIIVATKLRTPSAVLVNDVKGQLVKLNHCGEDYGGCSHLCLPKPQRVTSTEVVREFECACPDDMVLKDDYTCINRAETETSNPTQHTSNDMDMWLQTSTTTSTQTEAAEDTLKLMNTIPTPTEITSYIMRNATTKKTEMNESAQRALLKEIWQDLYSEMMLIANSTNVDLTNEEKDEPSDCIEGDYNCRDAIARAFINGKTMCCIDPKQLSYTTNCVTYGEDQISCKCS